MTKPYAVWICCVFDRPHVSEIRTKTLESLIEHAFKNKLRQIPWQRFTWVGDFCTFTSAFSNIFNHKRPHARNRIRYAFKSFHSRDGFRDTCGIKNQTATKCLRIQMNPDTVCKVVQRHLFLNAENI